MDGHQTGVPSFFLFGEAPREVSERFIHVEALDDRSRPSHWNIRAHAHADLNHIFFIAAGSGVMYAEALKLAFEAPCLLIVPAAVVHGFTFEPETTGSVLTIADSYLRDLYGRAPDLGRLFAAPARLGPGGGDEVSEALARLSRELAWTAPGHAAAAEAHLLTVLVTAWRLTHHAGAAAAPADGSAAMLVARFRATVEIAYRSNAPIETYAARLGVSPTRLRRVCLAVVGRPPIAVVHARILLEAKRILTYSSMTIKETAFYLGFDDPAYFSRFFARREGISPRAFRGAALKLREESHPRTGRLVGPAGLEPATRPL